MGKADVFTGMSLTEKLIWLKKFGNGGGSGEKYADRTATGNPVIFTTNFAQNAKALSVDFAPKQNLNGYDHPWAGGAWKNLLPSDWVSATTNGVTFTKNADGSVKASGTATAAATRTVNIALKAGEYILTGCPTNGSSTTYEIQVENNGTYYRDYGSGRTFSLPEDATVRCILVVRKDQTVNLTFYPMIRKSTETDATYEPYENICQISGYTGVTVTRTGKNLLTNNMHSVTRNGITMTRNADGSFTFNGTATTNAGFYIAAEDSSAQTILPIKPGTYTLSGGASSGSTSTYRLAVYTYVDGAYDHAYSDFGNNRTFTISENENGYVPLINIYRGTTVSNLTFKPQLEVGNATEYEPYNGAIYSVTFPVGAGTVYGGTLNVKTGVLTATDALIASYNGEALPSTWLSDRDEYKVGTTPTVGAQVVYKLATPLTYQLTPQQIALLEGENVIATDGDSLNVTYQVKV